MISQAEIHKRLSEAKDELRVARANAKIAEGMVKAARFKVEAVQDLCTHPNAIEHRCGDYGGSTWKEVRCADCGMSREGTLEGLRAQHE